MDEQANFKKMEQTYVRADNVLESLHRQITTDFLNIDESS